MRALGTCINCRENKATLEAHGLELCSVCEPKISKQLDCIRDLRRINTQQYGNKAGTINDIEYLYGDQWKRGKND